MRKIIYTRPDGGVSVVTPVRNTLPVLESLTDAEIEQRAWNKLPPDAIDPRFVEADAIPVDRSFREAWKADGAAIAHDMAKCREIHKERLRQLRAPKLAALDTEYMRADEAGDAAKKAEIAARKQALRDVTKAPEISAARTPEELKAAIPAALSDAKGE